jgi:DHA1 family bicyclomycin/chloramphenicol resistance-like MFS transporter
LHPAVLISLLTAMTAISTASNSQALPSLPSMGAEFGASAFAVQLTVSGFLLAFALAQLVWGPIADRYGRRPTLIAGLLIYFAASVACWQAPTIEALVVFRLVQAFGACCPPVVSRAVVRDLFALKDAARVMAFLTASFSLAPVLAPAVGAFLEEWFGWRANFLFMVAWGGGLLAAVPLLLPETLPPRRTGSSLASAVMSYGPLFVHRTFIGYSLAVALGFSMIAGFNSMGAFYLIDGLGLPPKMFAVYYGIPVALFGLSAYLGGRVTPALGLDRTVVIGILLCLAGGALIAALAVFRVSGPWALSGPMIVMSIGHGFLFPNCQAGAIAPFPDRAGAASALSGFFTMAVAAVTSAFIMRAYDGTYAPFAYYAPGASGVLLVLFWLLVLRGRPASEA